MREKLDTLVEEMVGKGILYEDAQREFERRYIAHALRHADGCVSRAADILGIHRNTLARKITAYRLKGRP